jgi:hypothetical protein
VAVGQVAVGQVAVGQVSATHFFYVLITGDISVREKNYSVYKVYF